MSENSKDHKKIFETLLNYIDNENNSKLTPNEEYELYDQYKKLLNYVIDNFDNYYLLYDVWSLLKKVSKRLTTGFFVNTWEEYKEKIKNKLPPEEVELFESFIGSCSIEEGRFYRWFKIAKFPPPSWHKKIQKFLIEFNNDPNQIESRSLYSIANLYISLFSVNPNEEDILKEQIRATEQTAKYNNDNDQRLIKPNYLHNFDQNNIYQNNFIQLFLYLYRYIDYFNPEKNKFNDFVEEIETEILGKSTSPLRESTLSRLLKYWAANLRFMRAFLSEKLKFEFHIHTSHPPKEIKVPSPHGSDNYIFVFGDRGVGKTSFLYASEYASQQNQDMLSMSVENKKLQREVENNEVENNRNKWQEGQDLSFNQNSSIRLQTEVHCLTRLICYEIEGFDGTPLSSQVNRNLPSPCAIIIMLEANMDSNRIQHYEGVVNLLQELAKQDENYRDIAIYFVINKCDQLPNKHFELLSLRSYQDEKIADENADEKKSRYENLPNTLHDVESCCRNLAFLHQLDQDIKKVQNFINKLSKSGFNNLSFAYTSCSYNSQRKYNDLQMLWSDLSDYVIQATLDNRKQYYQQEFEDRLDRDFKAVEWFSWSAKINPELGLDTNKLNNLIQLSNSTEDFENIKENIDEAQATGTDGNLERSLPKNFYMIDKYCKEFELEVNTVLRDALKIILRELGISWNEKIKDIDQQLIVDNQSDRKLIFEGSGDKTTVLDQLEKINNREQERKYCQLLKKPSSKYPTLYKDDLTTQENRLLSMINQLLNDYHFYFNSDSNQDSFENIRQKCQAKYLLKICKQKNSSLTRKFRTDPDSTIELLSRMISILNDAINIIDQKTPFFGIGNNNKEQEMLKQEIKKFNEELSKETELNLTQLNYSEKGQIKQMGKNLRILEIIYKKIRNDLIAKQEDINSLLTYIPPERNFPDLIENNGNYMKTLKEYKRMHKFLILRERVERLEAFEWINKLESYYADFLTNIYQDLYIDQVLDSEDYEQQLYYLKDEFKKRIEKIRNTQELWEKTNTNP